MARERFSFFRVLGARLSRGMAQFREKVMAHMRWILIESKRDASHGKDLNSTINFPSPSDVLHKHLMKKFQKIISPFFGFEPSEGEKMENENDSHR